MNDYLNRIAECTAAPNRSLSLNTRRTHSDAVVTVNEVRRVNFGMQMLFIYSQSGPFQHNRRFNFLLFPQSLCSAATSCTSSIVVSPAGNRAQNTSLGRKNILAYDVRVDARERESEQSVSHMSLNCRSNIVGCTQLHIVPCTKRMKRRKSPTTTPAHNVRIAPLNAKPNDLNLPERMTNARH